MGAGPILQIDALALARNWELIRAACGAAHLGAVIKNDAYGLGIASLAPLLERLGCRDYWVAHWDDALLLRSSLQAASASRIMTLHGLQEVDPAEFIHHGVTPIVASEHELQALAGLAHRVGRRLPIGVHLDTGLTRVGLGSKALRSLCAGQPIWQDAQPAWWVTHLGRFESLTAAQSLQQRQLFETWTAQLPKAPRTLASSFAALSDKSWHFDHVRVGSALWGLGGAARIQQGLQCVASLRARVLRVEEVAAGVEIGYGGTYRSTQTMRVATLEMGYGDGLPFQWSSTPSVWLAGQSAPMVGGVSMNMVGVDVSAYAPDAVGPGMWAQVYGPQQPLEKMAQCAGVPANAILTQTARLARQRYVQGVPLEQVVV